MQNKESDVHIIKKKKMLKADSLRKVLQDSINKRLKGLKSASTAHHKDTSTKVLAAQSRKK